MRRAAETAVENATEPVIELARSYMVKAYEDGIRYEVVVQGLDSYESLEPFTEALRRSRSFRSLKEIGASAEQARYYVYYMGRKSELIDDVMNSLGNQLGYENFSVLVSRGNAVVFGIER
jgi:hypothetical protein